MKTTLSQNETKKNNNIYHNRTNNIHHNAIKVRGNCKYDNQTQNVSIYSIMGKKCRYSKI